MIFPFTYNGIEFRYFILGFWTIYSLLKSRKIKLMNSLIPIPITLVVLAIYSMTILLLNNSSDYFVVLRLIRALVSYFVIVFFVSSNKYSISEIIDTIEMTLFIHAVIVIISVLLPSFKPMLNMINGYTKREITFRSTGLMNGYDGSGFVCVVGFIIHYMMNKYENKKNSFTIKSLIYLIATVFTSRFNILCMAGLILLISFIENKNKSSGALGRFFLFFFRAMFVVITVLFWVLTTNINTGIREALFSRFSSLGNVYDTLINSYTDYGKYTYVIENQTSLKGITFFDALFGKGIRPGYSDVGYIKTLYSVGIISIIVEFAIYFYTIKEYKAAVDSYYKYLMYLLIVILMMVMELKLSFVFSTTIFEIVTIIYVAEIILSKERLSTQNVGYHHI